jgi:hypothetical protein
LASSGVHIPLVGQPRLDHHAAAVAIGRLDGARFGVVFDFALPSFSTCGIRWPLAFIRRSTTRRARLEAVEADQSAGTARPPSGTRRFGIEHVEHVGPPNAGALAHFEVVEIMPGVIFTAPEPSSGSACSSAMIGMRRR